MGSAASFLPSNRKIPKTSSSAGLAEFLNKVGGIEEKIFLKIKDEKIKSIPEQDVDRTSAEGKASSVQFVHFEFTDNQIELFKDLSNDVFIGIDHDLYSHSSKLSDANKKALALDFS